MSQSLSFVIAFLFITLALPAQEKHTLRYDLKPGATVWMQMVQEMTQNTSRDGKETKIAMTTTMLMEGKATEVKDGVATIEQRYARIQLKCDSPMRKIDFDSDVEGAKPGQFRKDTDAIPAQTRIIIFDACRTNPDAKSATPSTGFQDERYELAKGTGIIFGAEFNAPAYEEPSLNHGAFTAYFQ